MNWRTTIALSCLLGLALARSSRAGFYTTTAQVTHGLTTTRDLSFDQPAPTSSYVVFSDLLTLAEASATSAHGSLGAFAQGGGIAVGTNNSASGAATAQYRVDDLIFSSQDESRTFVTTQMNLAQSGTFAVSAGADNGQSVGRATVSISGALYKPGVPGGFQFSGTALIELAATSTAGLVLTTDSFGVYSGLDLSTGSPHTLPLPEFTAPLGVPLNWDLSLSATGEFSAIGPDSLASGVSDFGSTLSFPTSGPVFDLPDGVTANSAQLNIVDNRWLGPGTTAAVPEPSSILLLGTGLFALAGVIRRRQDNTARTERGMTI